MSPQGGLTQCALMAAWKVWPCVLGMICLIAYWRYGLSSQDVFARNLWSGISRVHQRELGHDVLWSSSTPIWKCPWSLCPGSWQKRARREKVKRGTPAFFIYRTWTIISMRDISQRMLLWIPWDSVLQPTRGSFLLLCVRPGQVAGLLKEPLGWSISLL